MPNNEIPNMDRIKCPKCNQQLGVPNKMNGSCPRCSTPFQWQQIGDKESKDSDLQYDVIIWGSQPPRVPK